MAYFAAFRLIDTHSLRKNIDGNESSLQYKLKSFRIIVQLLFKIVVSLTFAVFIDQQLRMSILRNKRSFANNQLPGGMRKKRTLFRTLC